MGKKSPESRMKNTLQLIAHNPESFVVGYRFGEDMFRSTMSGSPHPGPHQVFIETLHDKMTPQLRAGIYVGYMATARAAELTGVTHE